MKKDFICPSPERIHAVLIYLGMLDHKAKRKTYEIERLASSFKQASIRLFAQHGVFIDTWGKHLFTFSLFEPTTEEFPTFEKALQDFCGKNKIDYEDIPHE